MKLPQSPRAVVFDMDGLLFDTESLYIRSLITAAAEYGYEMTWDLYRPMLGSPWHVNRHSLLLQYGPSFPVDDVRSLWLKHFSVLCQTELALKAGVSELLDLLDELDLPRAIATSSFRHSVDHHLEAHGLTHRFHQIVAYGDYVESKPAPDPFLAAAVRLGIEPRSCLALEDSHNGIRSASGAGMMTIMVPDQMEPNEEILKLCLGSVSSLHEVHRLVAEANGRLPI
jgi:HAD superfamily hydrolase (TIGR01509 family)